jgi:hypothetical protein
MYKIVPCNSVTIRLRLRIAADSFPQFFQIHGVFTHTIKHVHSLNTVNVIFFICWLACNSEF